MDRLAHILNRKGMQTIQSLMKEKRHHVPMYRDDIKDKIINLICDYYKADVHEVINSKTRLGNIIMAKYMSMYFISKDYPELKDAQISKLFGTHRTTFLHAKNKISNLLDVDKSVKEEYKDLRKRIDNLYL
jgi:chromosomal replication initiation ATPase DnaA